MGSPAGAVLVLTPAGFELIWLRVARLSFFSFWLKEVSELVP